MESVLAGDPGGGFGDQGAISVTSGASDSTAGTEGDDDQLSEATTQADARNLVPSQTTDRLVHGERLPTVRLQQHS